MNKINRKVEYSLIALKHMRSKSQGELTTVKELSNLYGCPFDVLSRVLQVLTQKGVLRSEQGAHGGYMIIRDLQRLSFFELVEMILGPMSVAKCLHEKTGPTCDIRETCNIVSPVLNLNKKLAEFYRGINVAEILDPKPTVSSGRAVVDGLASLAASTFNEPLEGISG